MQAVRRAPPPHHDPLRCKRLLQARLPHLKKTNLNYGHIDHILRWLERFPDYILVPAHGGGCCGGEMEIMAEAVRAHGWKNVYTDTSHRGVEYILKAVEFFGEDRVLYATDWPFDTCTCNVKCHIEALGDNPTCWIRSSTATPHSCSVCLCSCLFQVPRLLRGPPAAGALT